MSSQLADAATRVTDEWRSHRPRYIFPRHENQEWEYEAELRQLNMWCFRELCPWILDISGSPGLGLHLPKARLWRCLIAVWPHPWYAPVAAVVPELYSLVGLHHDVLVGQTSGDAIGSMRQLLHALTMVHALPWHEPFSIQKETFVSSHYHIRVQLPYREGTKWLQVHAWQTLMTILQFAEHCLGAHQIGCLRLVCHRTFLYDSLEYSLFSAAVDPGSLVEIQFKYVPERSDDHMIRV